MTFTTPADLTAPDTGYDFNDPCVTEPGTHTFAWTAFWSIDAEECVGVVEDLDAAGVEDGKAIPVEPGLGGLRSVAFDRATQTVTLVVEDEGEPGCDHCGSHLCDGYACDNRLFL